MCNFLLKLLNHLQMFASQMAFGGEASIVAAVNVNLIFEHTFALTKSQSFRGNNDLDVLLLWAHTSSQILNYIPSSSTFTFSTLSMCYFIRDGNRLYVISISH